MAKPLPQLHPAITPPQENQGPTISDKLLAAALVTGAIIITVVIVADDVFLVLIADNIPGYALVASMVTRAGVLLRGSVAVPVAASSAAAYSF